MADRSWPTVGLKANAIPAHAANIRDDIENLHNRITQGAKSVPSKVFLQFSSSIIELLEKLVDQLSLKDVMDAVNRIDQNTKTILENTPSSTSLPISKELTPSHLPIEVSMPEPKKVLDLNMLATKELGQSELVSTMNQPDDGMVFTAGTSSKLILHDKGSKQGMSHSKQNYHKS